MPKVSVIIPCYNLGKYLDDAVASVLHQTFRDLEIIIVNDGSNDPFTCNLLAHYDKPLTRVLTTGNHGVAAARNYGIRSSSGTYICCLDADDAYHPDFLAETVPVLDQDEDHTLGFVTTGIVDFAGAPISWRTAGFDPIGIAIRNSVHVASLFRRECWEKVGGYCEHLAGFHDWCFWISVVAAGYRWHRIDKPLFFYRIRPDSMLRASYLERNAIYRDIVRHNRSYYSANFEAIITRLHEELDAEQRSGLDLAARLEDCRRLTCDVAKERDSLRATLEDLSQRLHSEEQAHARTKLELEAQSRGLNAERQSTLDLAARLEDCRRLTCDLTKERDSLRATLEDLSQRLHSEEQAHARTKYELEAQSCTLAETTTRLTGSLDALAAASSANAALQSKLAAITNSYPWRMVMLLCRALIRFFPDNPTLRSYLDSRANEDKHDDRP